MRFNTRDILQSSGDSGSGITSREFPRDQIVGHSLQELLGPLYSKNLPYIRAAYAGETQVFEREIPAPDGRIRCSLATYTPYVVDGTVHGIFVHVADVTRLKKLEEEQGTVRKWRPRTTF